MRQVYPHFHRRVSISAAAVCMGLWLGTTHANPTAADLTLSTVSEPILSCDRGLIENGPSEGKLASKALSVRLPFLPEPQQHRWVANFLSKSDEKLIVVEDDPHLHTTVLTALPEYLRTTKGNMIFLIGMGGFADKYGAPATGRPFASTVLSRGYFPAVVQNWVYGGTGHLQYSREERLKVAERFSDLANQQRAHAAFLSAMGADTDAWREFRPHETVRTNDVVGRSHGTGESLQLVSDASRGNAMAIDAVKTVRSIVVTGLNDPDLIAKWGGEEDALEARAPGTLDRIATTADRRLYNQMTWTKPAPAGTSLYKGHLPAVVAVIGGRDEFVPVADQVATMEKFSALHPNLRVLLVFTDMFHDPMRKIDWWYQTPDMLAAKSPAKRVKMNTGGRFWQVMERAVVGGNGPTGPFEPLLPQLVAGNVARYEMPEYGLLQYMVPSPVKEEVESKE